MSKRGTYANKVVVVAACLALMIGLMIGLTPTPSYAADLGEGGEAEGQPPVSRDLAGSPDTGKPGGRDSDMGDSGAGGFGAAGPDAVEDKNDPVEDATSEPGELQGPVLPGSTAIQSDPVQPDFLTAQANSPQNEDKDVKVEPHDPYKHAKDSHITQGWGPNTVLIHCEWEYQFPASFAPKQVCQFHEWPLIVMSRPDDYYDGKPKEAYFNWMTMKDYPFGKQYVGFPYEFAEWDGVFTYTGVNGTVEYGPTDKAPIGEGTYYVYAKVRIPSAVSILSDGTFILGTTFTIEPSGYKVRFDANPPNSASTTATGTMPELNFNSRVETRQLPPNQFVLPGYEFDSWNTKEDGSGDRYGNNALVKDLSYAGRSVTLFARWKPKTYKITYDPGDASIGSPVTKEAIFDKPGTLAAIAELGWNSGSRSFLGWATDGFALLYDDQEDYVNLGGEPRGYYNDPPDVTLTAQWAAAGEIVVSVTKDGAPQGGLEGCFSLKSIGGTTFTMPTLYENGRYVFDPSQASQPGGSPAALPPDIYDLCFERIGPLGGVSYPAASLRFKYEGAPAVVAVFDYYTANMVKDPAFKDVCRITMEPDNGASMAAVPNVYKANVLDGATLKLATIAAPGYHFDGYSAAGVAPIWEGGNPMKPEQTVTVQGQVEIMAHVAANAYTVRFNANTDAAVIGQMEKQGMVYDEPQNLFANNFVRSGAVFAGWNTKADGSGTAYEDGQSVKNLTMENGAVLTLYAQWKETPVSTALLTFDLGDGTLDGQTGSITLRANEGDVIEMPAAPTREGYTFKYWKGSEFYPGDKYKVEGSHAFSAVWEKKSSDSKGGSDTEGSGANGTESPSAPSALTKASSPSAGDALGGLVGALVAVAACALCLAIAVAFRRRNLSGRAGGRNRL